MPPASLRVLAVASESVSPSLIFFVLLFRNRLLLRCDVLTAVSFLPYDVLFHGCFVQTNLKFTNVARLDVASQNAHWQCPLDHWLCPALGPRSNREHSI